MVISQDHKDEQRVGRTLERTSTRGPDRPSEQAAGVPEAYRQRDLISLGDDRKQGVDLRVFGRCTLVETRDGGGRRVRHRSERNGRSQIRSASRVEPSSGNSHIVIQLDRSPGAGAMVHSRRCDALRRTPLTVKEKSNQQGKQIWCSERDPQIFV